MPGKSLGRRTLLRGMGTAIALPLLDSMIPAFTRAAVSKAPCRMAMLYVPNGIIMDQWTPAAAGKDFAFTRILKPLEPFRDDITIVS